MAVPLCHTLGLQRHMPHKTNISYITNHTKPTSVTLHTTQNQHQQHYTPHKTNISNITHHTKPTSATRHIKTNSSNIRLVRKGLFCSSTINMVQLFHLFEHVHECVWMRPAYMYACACMCVCVRMRASMYVLPKINLKV